MSPKFPPKQPNRPQAGAAATPSSNNSVLDVLGDAIDPKLREINAAVARARAAGWNVLAPHPILEIAQGFRVALAAVRFNASPDMGDVYKQFQGEGEYTPGNDKFALRRTALLKIADAFGLIWLIDRCRRTDDRSTPEVVEYQAAARYLGFDGRHIERIATYEIDVRAREEELRQIEWSKWGRTDASKRQPEERQKDYIENKVYRERVQWMRHRVPRAETGAVERLVRSLGVEGSYTAAQLAQPFLIARVLLDPQDEAGRRMVYANALQAGSDLYGPGTSGVNAPPAPAPDPEEPAPSAPRDSKPANAPPPATPAPPELPAPAGEDDFYAIEPADQVVTLEALMRRKAYALPDLAKVMKKKGYSDIQIESKHPVEYLTPGDRVLLFQRLKKMPSVLDDGDEDIPF